LQVVTASYEEESISVASAAVRGSDACRWDAHNLVEPVMTSITRFALPLGIALTAACGSSEVPAKQMAESQASIRAASEVGAEQHPQAALHLKMARDQIAKAEALSRDGEHDAAKQLLKQAELDAELALTLTREQQAESSAEQAQQQLESLSQ
jgi:hypothetical protein